MSDDLQKITLRVDAITVRGVSVEVREVTMRDLSAFVQACTPFMSAFDEAGELAARDDRPADDFALFRVLAANGPAFVRAAALTSNQPAEFYEGLRPDEFFEIAAKVVEVNGDFFIRALAPSLIKFARGVSLIGSMLSAGSSAPDTPTPGYSTTHTASSTASPTH